MKYRDLIQFEPLESTIAIREADSKDKATSLVASYVISDEMADRFSDILCPQLQFEQPADNKGVLIVGNYGTGKSHLMSLISAIAEHGDLVDSIRNPKVRADVASFAGKFKVVRTELNTTASLRDTLCSVLETYLHSIGIDYQFPAADARPNNKIAIEEMMAVFGDRYPDQGLLLVVDEMLDYLRSRMAEGTYAVIADFNFLRELGEISKQLKFRFIAGVQVSLFESSEFEFVADSLRRVKDRFEQVMIARRDIKFVVAERLLAKTAEQKVKIREHLTPFIKFYGDMGDRLDEFVNLFPIHPDYIDVFETLTIVEKRQVMKSLTLAIKVVLDRDVPVDQPGIIAFDHYWSIVKEDASLRSNPDVREVIDCSNKLESLIETGLSKKAATKAVALQIVRALSVYRLAVGNIESPIGLTAENLRDRLCVYDMIAAEMGGEPAEDMRSAIETALRLIRKTVNGQFISSTERDGGQYYLDIRKTVDYDAQIEKKASTLDRATLDRYYFNVLRRVLGQSDQTIVTGYQIWEHQLEWLERKASRLGYLFFGAPNDRSTAQPPREFYLYFLPRYREAEFKDEKRSDEVFFRLDTIDQDFEKALRQYAATLDLAISESGGEAKRVYNDRGESNLKLLVAWLQEHLTTAFSITYQGKKQPFMAWLKGNTSAPNLSRANVGDLVNVVSSVCLAPYFADRAPEYPYFPVVITEENRAQAAQDALRGISEPSKRTKQAIAILSALELLDGDRLVPDQSRYANHLLGLLLAKGQGQVLNYHELIQETFSIPYMEIDRYRLEPEWVIVIIAALVREFNYTFVIPGKQFDAMKSAELANTPIKDLINFQYVKPPKDYDINALKALCTLLGVETGKAVVITQGGKAADEATAAIAQVAMKLLERVVTTQQVLANKLALFGRSILGDGEQAENRSRLNTFKDFLNSLQSYNTPAKLKNFKYDAAAVNLQHTGLDTLRELDRLHGLVTQLSESAAYLSQAELVLPNDHAWVMTWRTQKENIFSRVIAPAERSNSSLDHQLSSQLQQLKRDYIQAYQTMHVRSRLGNTASTHKQQLQSDSRLKDLRSLAVIKVVNVERLERWENDLAKLKDCFKLTDFDLQTSPLCPHCGFKPSSESHDLDVEQRLQELDNDLDRILTDWTDRLGNELSDPTTQSNRQLLTTKRQKLVTTFCSSKVLPQPVNKEFVEAVSEVLSSLNKIAIAPSDLIAVLTSGGMPTNPDELEIRFKDYLGDLLKGKDRKNVRIFIEE